MAKSETAPSANNPAREALKALQAAQKNLQAEVLKMNPSAIAKYNACASEIICLERIAKRFDSGYFTVTAAS